MLGKGLEGLGKGLYKRRDKGLISEDKGLDTLIRAGLLRPVQIMRQTISNLDIFISPLLAYHNYKGLSSPPKAGGIEKIP
jgi:hypothetical protein